MKRRSTHFLVTKLTRAVFSILLLVTGVFVLLRNAGDPIAVFLGPDATPEMKTAFASKLGLDRPLQEQYFTYIANIFEGSFGLSYVYRRDSFAVVVEHLGATLLLMLPALALAILVGITAGVMAAVLRGTMADRMITAAISTGLCIPAFFLGLILMLVFAIQLRLLPTNGAETWRHLILPALTISAANAAVLARYTRATMSEVLGSPFVLAAKARDVPFWRILVSHALPNAASPILSVMGLLLGGMVTGSIVVEAVFSWPGMGNLFITSIGNRDIPVVQAIVILAGAAMILSNFAVDILYVVVDPRARRQEG
ncbi:ABC transporter permease subunit [Sinorhizobium medicae]|uniref:ABC transporter permease n=1 Tax=Sinorhizobium medicae TaxID=110321 RepID=UPI0012950E96|nr:ABC transporter permease [Sinorhizobium medicae]MDX0414776.1 ABC transporter permease subunit [Sinorhizobium medicae]MDX0469407.1 ABC transporter permease subunit [Sinorhizobium medicae]MDX0475730.1 ABC transporter permease subunit [Sinorhizobium medicae]MDX0900948.1 ABC transporter permease subunit [Sinorhizobium medicae]MDX1176559.1 ABC transporter permease subunit [Sinorhizobium medicae]